MFASGQIQTKISDNGNKIENRYKRTFTTFNNLRLVIKLEWVIDSHYTRLRWIKNRRFMELSFLGIPRFWAQNNSFNALEQIAIVKKVLGRLKRNKRIKKSATLIFAKTAEIPALYWMIYSFWESLIFDIRLQILSKGDFEHTTSRRIRIILSVYIFSLCLKFKLIWNSDVRLGQDVKSYLALIVITRYIANAVGNFQETQRLCNIFIDKAKNV